MSSKINVREGKSVTNTMIEVLKSASAKQPVRKIDITRVLARKFRDHSRDSLHGTVTSLVMPSEMAKRGVKLVVVKTEDGRAYYAK